MIMMMNNMKIKKLICIIALGLLVSCSPFFDKKKIEKCADPRAIKDGAILSDKYGIIAKESLYLHQLSLMKSI